MSRPGSPAARNRVRAMLDELAARCEPGEHVFVGSRSIDALLPGDLIVSKPRPRTLRARKPEIVTVARIVVDEQAEPERSDP